MDNPFERKQFEYKQIMIRLPFKKAEILEKEAKANLRTLAKQILYITMKHIDELEKQK